MNMHSYKNVSSCVQIVFLRSQRGSPALFPGYDSLKKLHPNPSPAALRECSTQFCLPILSIDIVLFLHSFPLVLYSSNIWTYLPLPQCVATIVILCIGETHNLINYVSFINYLSYGVTIAGLLYLRKKRPNLARPIKVQWSTINSLQGKKIVFYFTECLIEYIKTINIKSPTFQVCFN